MIGLGGASIPKALNKLVPHAELNAVDINPALIPVNREYFNFTEGVKNKIFVEDGFDFVKNAPSNSYDIVLVDGYDVEYIAPQLLSDEFFKNIKRITDEFGYDGGAFYSPDGNNIVWRAWYPSNEEEKEKWSVNLTNRYIDAVPLDIYVAKRDGSDKKRLTDNGATNWSPSWHPDGKHIIFSSNKDDWRDDYNAYGSNFELYMIHIKSLKIQRLTNNDTFDSFPVISENGKITFSSNRNAKNPRQTNIFIGSILNK